MEHKNVLTQKQISQYHAEGYLFLPNHLTLEEITLLRDNLPSLYSEDSPGKIFEEGTNIIRMIHAPHKSNPVFGCLVRHDQILLPTMQLLDSKVYIHQFRLNHKAAFVGEVWQWHQDYIFWQQEDRMPTPRAVNVCVFLDEVNEFNGALLLIPGTHKVKLDDEEAHQNSEDENSASMSYFSSTSLKYTLEQRTIARFAHLNGIVSPKGAGGSVLFFHPCIFHGSGPNMSPFDRTLGIITYNSVENKLLDVENPRPWFLANRDYTPLTLLEKETFV